MGAAELIHVNRQMDRHDRANRHFSQLHTNAPKSLYYDIEQDGSVTYLTGKSWQKMNVEK